VGAKWHLALKKTKKHSLPYPTTPVNKEILKFGIGRSEVLSTASNYLCMWYQFAEFFVKFHSVSTWPFWLDCHQNTNHGFTKFNLPGMSNDKAEVFKKFKIWEGHQLINRNWGLSSFRLIGICQLKCYHPLLGKPAGLFLKLPVKKFTWLMDIVIKENENHANFNQLFLCNESPF